MREAVLLDVPHVAEAGLLEHAPGAAVRLLDGRDERSRLGAGEDDRARELPQNPGAEPAARRIGLADEEVDPGRLGLRADELAPLGVVSNAVGLDQSDARPSSRIT